MIKQGYTELTLNLLQKSPEVAPLLVQLHDKHKLYALAKKRRPDARAELAAIMADLLQIKLNPSETELITDVLMGLLRQAEIDLKRAVSERLAVMENIPLRLAVHLANEEIIVADPILRKSRALDDNDLIYIVKSQTQEHWRAIASRAQISANLINVLADTKDLGTAICLSENKNITLSEHSMNIFADLAKTSESLAKPLLRRKELPKELVKALYNFVGYELKEMIKHKYPTIDTDAVAVVVDDIVFEIAECDEQEISPTDKMISLAESMMRMNSLTPIIMVDNLRRGQTANFVAMFSVYCGLPLKTVKQMITQKTAQGLAVACKATAIQKPEFINIFLLTSRFRGGKVVDNNELARALSYYDKIKESVARQILNQSRH